MADTTTTVRRHRCPSWPAPPVPALAALAALGWAWGLVLAGLAPDTSDAVLQPTHAFGQSRVICGVHWQSNVDNGRLMGAAAIARLQSHATFQAQLALARQEIAAARAKGAKSPLNCAAETAALGR